MRLKSLILCISGPVRAKTLGDEMSRIVAGGKIFVPQ